MAVEGLWFVREEGGELARLVYLRPRKRRVARETGTASQVRDTLSADDKPCACVLVCLCVEVRSIDKGMTTPRAGLGSSVPRPRPAEPAQQGWCVGDG
jgi:hypothetical protein